MSERAELEKRAKEIAGPHLECEDPWYSCPLSPEGCADDRQHGCTCGADTRAKEIVALCAAAQAENERLRAENERLILQYTIAECWWEDGDTRYDSPEEYADEQSLTVGAEFELTASTYWQEKYRVTKVRSETDDDFECEQISKQREEFVTYQEMKARLAKAESELAALRSVEKG